MFIHIYAYCNDCVENVLGPYQWEKVHLWKSTHHYTGARVELVCVNECYMYLCMCVFMQVFWFLDRGLQKQRRDESLLGLDALLTGNSLNKNSYTIFSIYIYRYMKIIFKNDLPVFIIRSRLRRITYTGWEFRLLSQRAIPFLRPTFLCKVFVHITHM